MFIRQDNICPIAHRFCDIHEKKVLIRKGAYKMLISSYLYVFVKLKKLIHTQKTTTQVANEKGSHLLISVKRFKREI